MLNLASKDYLFAIPLFETRLERMRYLCGTDRTRFPEKRLPYVRTGAILLPLSEYTVP